MRQRNLWCMILKQASSCYLNLKFVATEHFRSTEYRVKSKILQRGDFGTRYPVLELLSFEKHFRIAFRKRTNPMACISHERTDTASEATGKIASSYYDRAFFGSSINK